MQRGLIITHAKLLRGKTEGRQEKRKEETKKESRRKIVLSSSDVVEPNLRI